MSNLVRLLTVPEATEFLRVNPQFLAKDRCTKRLVPFVKVGRRVFYREDDLMAFIERNTVGALTSAQSEAIEPSRRVDGSLLVARDGDSGEAIDG